MLAIEKSARCGHNMTKKPFMNVEGEFDRFFLTNTHIVIT